MLVQRLLFYVRLWLRFGAMAIQTAFINRSMVIFFLLAKTVRYGMAFLLLFTLHRSISAIGNYSIDHLVVFFIVYMFIDNTSQIFFRGVYEFSYKVKRGELDFDLTKPVSILFRALLGTPDINDVFIAVPMTALNIYILSRLNIAFLPEHILLFAVLIISGFAIATAMHIFVLAMGVITTEIENVIMLYRDLSRQAQIPVTLHNEVIRFILYFIIPVGLMMTVPAEALLGFESSVNIAVVFFISIAFLSASLWAWKEALKRYTSASS